MNWYIYIIKCKNGSLYTGITTNIEKRFKRHVNGIGANHTKRYKPIKIIYTEKLLNKKQVLKREKQIKGWTRKKKENLVRLK